MLNKFLKGAVIVVAGKQAEDITTLLNSKKHVNEFILAKKLDITINQTRNILYKIADKGLVSSVRKKDKKKGWYTYFWKIDVLKCLEFLRGLLIKRMKQVNYQIKSRKMKQFYICKRCNIEFSEENALIHNFICNECGNVFNLKDNSKFLKELGKDLKKLKRELALVEEEIKKEKQQIEKQKIRELRKKEKERKSKKIIRKKSKKKTIPVKKKSKKKIMKKKPARKKKIKKPTRKKTKKKVKKKPKKKKPKKKSKKQNLKRKKTRKK